jgi:hypothetical protein
MSEKRRRKEKGWEGNKQVQSGLDSGRMAGHRAVMN